jgi:hypothetical protein
MPPRISRNCPFKWTNEENKAATRIGGVNYSGLALEERSDKGGRLVIAGRLGKEKNPPTGVEGPTSR